MNKITHFGSSDYINHKFLEYFNSVKERNIHDIIKFLNSKNLTSKQITLSLINMINENMSPNELILHLDILNYFVSSLYDDKKKVYTDILEEKLLFHLGDIENGDLKSIIYQFVIDYSTFYGFSLKKFKLTFPIDRVMLLRRIAELATTKKYLNFFLAYELLNFFSKKDINDLWDIIISLEIEQQIFVFYIFHSYFEDYEKKRYIYSFFSSLEKDEQLKFLPYLRNYYPEKKLFFLNTLNITNEEWSRELNPSWFHKGFFSQASIYYFSDSNSFIFLTEFFDYTKYTFWIECDLNFNFRNSLLFKNPIEFNKINYILNIKNNFPNSLSLKRVDAIAIFNEIMSHIPNKEFSSDLILLNYFVFKGDLKGRALPFDKLEIIESNNYNENFYIDLIDKSFDNFIDINYIKSMIVSEHKLNIKQLTFLLKSPIIVRKIDQYISENKEIIIKKIIFLKKVSFVTGEVKISYYFQDLENQLNSSNNSSFIINISILHDFIFNYIKFTLE